MKNPSSVSRPRRSLRLVLLIGAATVLAFSISVSASATPAKINGEGSSYVGLAMSQWVSAGTTNGLPVNYLPTSSPQGLDAYAHSVVDFAATEAEFSALSPNGTDEGLTRGYQYVPDVAGAVAIMYNVDDPSGKKVTTLHLSRLTVAKIFMGVISSWDDPAITADNKGYPLPAQPISVVFRSGSSGTTALFYDFVAGVDPADFGPWAAKNGYPTKTRIIELDTAPFAPKLVPENGSDQIAQYVASPTGKWSIAYDEFGYAKTFNVPAAWIENQSHNWVLPYAQNIASALKSATLRPDLSQELSGVYVSTAPDAYPISAYSYLVTQCKPDPARPTCKGGYDNPGITETLSKWLRYIACDGQVPMAQIGYSPLPPNLSNEIAKSIARMQGTAPEVLTQANCSNPTFGGSPGGPAPPQDVLQNVAPRQTTATGLAPGAGGGPANRTTKTTVAGPATQSTKVEIAGASPDAARADASAPAGVATVGGDGVLNSASGPSAWRSVNPVAYNRGDPSSGSSLPLIVLFVVVVLPPAVGGGLRLRRR